MESWHYKGQHRDEWPSWLLFTNYALATDTKRILIPQVEATHMVYPGDWIDRRPDGLLSIRPEGK